MNRQPLNVELLTLDDGTQKIAWDVKQLQSLLGISDLLHQEELSSSATTGVNSSGIPTIETVIAILDELGLKDLYEVRYRKQYATIIPKTDSKRPKVAIYVVQQQSEIALSIHDRIWTSQKVKISWLFEEHCDLLEIIRELYILPSEKPDFAVRLLETVGDEIANLSSFEERLDKCFSLTGSCELPSCSDLDFWKALKEFEQGKSSNKPEFDWDTAINYDILINDMIDQNICYLLNSDQRFPSTSRIVLSEYSEIKSLLCNLKTNIKVFFRSNGEKPENQQLSDQQPFVDYKRVTSPIDDDDF